MFSPLSSDLRAHCDIKARTQITTVTLLHQPKDLQEKGPAKTMAATAPHLSRPKSLVDFLHMKDIDKLIRERTNKFNEVSKIMLCFFDHYAISIQCYTTTVAVFLKAVCNNPSPVLYSPFFFFFFYNQ
jgi:hypothetical protein